MNNRDWPLKKRRSFYFVIQWNRLGEKSNYCRCVHFRFFFSVFFSLSFHWSLRIEWPRYLPGNSIFVIFFYSYFFDERVFFGFFFFNISFECVFFWGGGGFTGQRRKQKRNGIQPATICPPLTHFFPSFICFFFVWVNVCTEREGGGAADPPPSQRPISNDGG